ncbi:hypothetical protein SKAU_G00048450 [Synaphobranchus kaupii]|uniref:Uncharacterized protein n=1 Tax=Synaphobranchus kaupii TaxID=118154 RepID=A0A9Q1J9I5_SYNKA|nr:hypothetical protein SKAU_G00048450 [Synaphobranchus kaupii]
MAFLAQSQSYVLKGLSSHRSLALSFQLWQGSAAAPSSASTCPGWSESLLQDQTQAPVICSKNASVLSDTSAIPILSLTSQAFLGPDLTSPSLVHSTTPPETGCALSLSSQLPVTVHICLHGTLVLFYGSTQVGGADSRDLFENNELGTVMSSPL